MKRGNQKNLKEEGSKEGRKESSVNGTFKKKIGMLMRKWQRMISGNSEEEYGLLAAGHCVSRWSGRSHFVVCLPALQLFPFGGLRLVGIDGTRRRQQQEEDALQLVVRGL